ncbi:MAG TPA: extracellular solute-binding protein [Ktedonobacteraceae bacterium]|nr:extracellular solute-binding protein [Ktedonobacteraceae bacterium]
MSEQHNKENSSDVLNRRRFMQVAATTAGTVVLAACGGSTTTQPAQLTAVATTPPQQVAATVTAMVGKTYFPSGDPNVADAFTAPLPPYQSVFHVPGNGDTINSFAIISDPPVKPHDSNKFWQEFEKRLNAKWNASAVTSDVYPEKVGTLLASGNLPDLFMVDTNFAPALLQAIQQGAFTDLTPIYTSSTFKQDYPNLGKISPLSWQNSMINGKHYTVPRPRPLTGSGLLYRKDWADKVGIDPKSADDFFKLLQAFAKTNLDGGSSQTWGMGFNVSNTFAATQIVFFFNIFNVPNQWKKNSDGSLTYFIETDEFKQGLDFIRKVYAAGLFYPNSFTQSSQDVKDNFTAGKYGAYMDTVTGMPDQTRKLLQLHPTAKLGVMTPFGANGGQGNHWMGLGFNAACGIPSSTGSNEDRLKEMLRVLDYMAAPAFSIESNFLGFGIDGWDNTTTNGVQALTANGRNEIPGLANQANGNLVYYQPSITANPHLAQDQQTVTSNLLKIAIQNPTLGLSSQTAVKQNGVLASLVNDRISRIIKGTDPLSAVSDLISSWKAQGGAQIAKEYAAQLSKQ